MKIPSKQTLKKYGLSLNDYRKIYARQRGKCPICDRHFNSDTRAVIDHEHVVGWRSMSPQKRKTFARGLLCVYCNLRRAGRGMNLEIAKNLVDYFTDYNSRKVAGKKSNPPE